ncbi:DUF7009 family protein [Maribacter algicola]|uniref:DUF7009 family protein n=1 Tax=Meishania litoralis TaxID=3434685 RepID=A0ACC7LG91_9FLAO
MKIRIKGNSIRFRLTRTEVKVLCTDGRFEERTEFDNTFFSYAVAISNEVRQLTARFNDNTITLLLPKNELGDWEANDEVGFQNMFRLDNGKELFLLLEKDFACLENTAEDQSDNYPNPKAC